jgi:ubiquinone/menaquinone biosynthesis C-methylase UbiE
MQDPRSAETAAVFSQQAAAYASSQSHAFGGDLDILAAYAEPGQYYLCLDVGCGPGHTAFRIASKASVVIGVDIAQGMLAKARELAVQEEINNVVFQQAHASALPFQDGSFDLITCRTAAHHFHDLSGFLSEALRLLRPDGRLVLDDTLAPDDAEAAEVMQSVDLLRDHSHVGNLTAAQWRDAVTGAGFRIARDALYEELQPIDAWFDRMAVSAESREEITARLLKAPTAVRERLVVLDGQRITHLRRAKIILRAERC